MGACVVFPMGCYVMFLGWLWCYVLVVSYQRGLLCDVTAGVGGREYASVAIIGSTVTLIFHFVFASVTWSRQFMLFLSCFLPVLQTSYMGCLVPF